MAINGIITDFNQVMKSVNLNKKNNFKIGEVIKGKVMGFSDGKPILSLKGEIFSANSEVPLKLGQNINVFVNKKEGNTTFLKIIDPQSGDSDSKLLNMLLKENIPPKAFNTIKNLISKGLQMESSLLLFKKGLPDNENIIDLFKNFTQLKNEITSLKTLYNDILKNIEPELKNEFLNKFALKNINNQNLTEYLKDSLNSTEYKLANNLSTAMDLKQFLSKSNSEKIKKIIKFIDLNNILSRDEIKEAVFEIPYFNRENNLEYSYLEAKSKKKFKDKDIINIFFILDLSNINTLQISSTYYIKGKNLEITLLSEKDSFIKMLKEKKSILEDKLNNKDLNFIINIKKIQTENKKSDKISKPVTGGIDIKA